MENRNGIESRVRSIETAYAAHKTRYRAMHETIYDHEARLRRIEQLAPLLKINQFILMGLGASVIALIWGLLTGQVQLLFP